MTTHRPSTIGTFDAGQYREMLAREMAYVEANGGRCTRERTARIRRYASRIARLTGITGEQAMAQASEDAADLAAMA